MTLIDAIKRVYNFKGSEEIKILECEIDMNCYYGNIGKQGDVTFTCSEDNHVKKHEMKWSNPILVRGSERRFKVVR